MGKKQRLRKEVRGAAMAPTKSSSIPLALGSHKFRAFTGLDCAFGADIKDYPPYGAIPEEFKDGNAPANKVVSFLFFKGGSLEQFGLRLKVGIDRDAFYGALRAMLCSFTPKHEHKEAACAWLINEFTEAA